MTVIPFTVLFTLNEDGTRTAQFDNDQTVSYDEAGFAEWMEANDKTGLLHYVERDWQRAVDENQDYPVRISVSEALWYDTIREPVTA